jgi:hypothetical protein
MSTDRIFVTGGACFEIPLISLPPRQPPKRLKCSLINQLETVPYLEALQITGKLSGFVAWYEDFLYFGKKVGTEMLNEACDSLDLHYFIFRYFFLLWLHGPVCCPRSPRFLILTHTRMSGPVNPLF